MTRKDIEEILEYKLLKFAKKYDRIEPSYQGDLDMDKLVEETVEEFMKLMERLAEEGVE